MSDWLRMAGDVMEVYGKVLKRYPMSIVDVSMLPLPKTKMKIVLKGLYAEAPNKEHKELIESYFMLLSHFQDGVGPKPIDNTLIRGDVMENLDANIEIIDRWTAWQKLSSAETEILMSEWSQFKQANL